MRNKTKDISDDQAFEYIATLEFDDIIEFTGDDTCFVNKFDPNRIKELIEIECVNDKEDEGFYKEMFDIPMDS